jgi:hypothetical protein
MNKSDSVGKNQTRINQYFVHFVFLSSMIVVLTSIVILVKNRLKMIYIIHKHVVLVVQVEQIRPQQVLMRQNTKVILYVNKKFYLID